MKIDFKLLKKSIALGDKLHKMGIKPKMYDLRSPYDRAPGKCCGKQKQPSQYLLDMIALTDRQKTQGQTSPLFNNAKDAIKWLNS